MPNHERGEKADEYTQSSRDVMRMAAVVARITYRYLIDRVIKPTATNVDDIPTSWDRIDDRWFEAALCSEVAGARVVSVERGVGHDGTTSRQQFVVTYNDVGVDAGLPATVFAKGSPYLINRIALGATGMLRWEKDFYEDVRPELDIEAPVGYHSNYDARSGRSIHVIEDLVQTKGATFCSPTTPITRANAEDLVDLLAMLHGTYYASPRLDSQFRRVTEWKHKQRVMCTAMNLRKYHFKGLDKAAPVIPAEVLRRRDDTWPAIVAATELSGQGPMTLIHSDVHLGNWYRTRDDRMGLLDWQCLSRGHWSHDLSYAMSAVLEIEDRRAWERELLQRYIDGIEKHSGHRIPFDEAWLRYRQQIFGALIMWTPTYAPPAAAPKNMQPEATSIELLKRFTQAIVDLDSFDSVGLG